jgi:N6-L-threonylcarbamoyladenine synthase
MPDTVLLALETSCDDTAAAVLVDGADAAPRVASSVVAGQDAHAVYGGVVPEVASRAHEQLVVRTVQRALAEAAVTVDAVTAVAATVGPGLAGSLHVGLSFTKAFAHARGLPFIGVNHLEGHLYSAFLAETPPAFPFLALVVSGGHTLLVHVEAGFRHRVLGRTRDDAAGEAFDKVGKLLGLGFPGGPVIDRLAESGDPGFVAFPRTRLPAFDTSFSGIKTAVRYWLDALPDRDATLSAHLPDVCASFQAAVVDMLTDPLARALAATGAQHVALVGGVSANRALRTATARVAARHGATLSVPPMRYCTDNAAMIGLAGLYRLQTAGSSPLTLTAQPALGLAALSETC